MEKSNVVDLAAFRKKKELEKARAKKTSEPDKPNAGEKGAEVRSIRSIAPATPKTDSRFLKYVGTDETKNWWVKLGIAHELGIPGLLKKINRATQGKFSPTTLLENIKLVEGYTDEEIIDYLKKSDEKKWQQKPTFYRALITVLDKRM